MNQKLLVIGANGLVGKVCTPILKEKYKFDLMTPTSEELDITDKASVETFVANAEVTTILLLAANTDVDGAEKDGGIEARRVNVEGTKNVAEASKKYSKHLIYISTDFVFSGSEDNKGPYSVTSKTENIDSKLIGEYAKSKLMGEIAVKESGCQFMIVRISYPFGNPNSEKDFANKTIKLIKSGYGLFTDQKFSPTYIPDLADAVSKIVQNNLTGVCHVVCSSVTTPHEFGQYLSDKLGLGEVKQSLLKEFMVGRTPKPLFGGLVASKELVDRNWKEAVDNFVSET